MFATNLIGWAVSAPAFFDAGNVWASYDPKWSGATVIAAIGLVVTATLALAAFFSTRAIARRKATLDLIEKAESTEYYRSVNAVFSRLRRGEGFAHLGDPVDDKARGEREAVLAYLNHYELIAIGIFDKVLDEQLYRAWMRAALLRDWNAAGEFIQQERWRRDGDGWRYHPTTWGHYQRLARRWSPFARQLDEQSAGPVDQSRGVVPGPGDDPLPSETD